MHCRSVSLTNWEGVCVGGERKRGVLGSGAEGSCVIFSAGDREAAGDKKSELISARCKFEQLRSRRSVCVSQLRRTAFIDTHPLPSTTSYLPAALLQ